MWDKFLKFMNNSSRENKGNHSSEGVWLCDPNYHKIRWAFALNFSRNYWYFEKLYTWKRVSSGIQTLRGWSKKTRLRLVFSTHFSVDDNIRICFWNAERKWMNAIIGLEWKWMYVTMAFNVMMTFIHCLSAFQTKILYYYYLFPNRRAYALIIC